MPDLEQELRLLSDGIEWPATPNLGSAVRRRIEIRRRQWFESRWALAAAVAIVALAALVAYTPSRDAIAGWLNVHTTFQQVPHLATPTPLPPGPLGARLGLGGRITLQKARVAVTWNVLLPPSLGEPDEVYLLMPPAGPVGGEVTLVYGARLGIPTSGQTGVAALITEARGKVDSEFFGKTLGPGTTIDVVTVAGHPGYWIAGSPHIFFLVDDAGNVRNETLRLATNTLLIDEGGLTVRIEGDLTRSQALEIGASLG